MALTQRFLAIDKAILVATGNSLVVCGSSTASDVNTSSLIKVDGTTTRDWTQAASTASLNMLSNSTVLYAELVWYSTVKSNVAGATDLRSIQDDAITFTTSQGSYQIIPQYTESYTGASGTIDRYRATNVTSYVQAALSGSYTVSNVPISVPSTGLSNSRGGWTLVVAYRNDVFQPQKILYNSGIGPVTTSAPLQMTMAGFTTSSDPTQLQSSLFLAAANGEPINGQESVLVGPSFAQLSNVGNPVNRPNPNPGIAPNNPGNNFFPGVINIADPLNSSNGLINIVGTNGTNNHDGFVPTQLVGARNKWDITNVNISSTLVTNQTLLATQITEAISGDGIQVVATGTQVRANAPDMVGILQLYDVDDDNENNVEVGNRLVYSVRITNSGNIDANNVIVSSTLSSSVTFVPNSITINGVASPGSNISNGINVGTIPAKGVLNLKFTVIVNSVPQGGLLNSKVNYSYQFVSGQSTITNYANTNQVTVIVQEGKLNITKSASKTAMSVGETVTYTVNITNVGTELATDMFFQDKVELGSSFVAGSVIIGGTPNATADPTVGISLPDLAAGASVQIVFQATATLIPPSAQIQNAAVISFAYIYNQYGYPRKKTIYSNITTIQVQYIDVVGERCNNNDYPQVGNTVTYTLNLTNLGNISATDVQVLEPAIPGATFVSGSVKINGISQPTLNPFTGFTLLDPINSLQTTAVEYKVLVNSIDPNNLIENIAQVPFKYQIVQGGTVIDAEIDSNVVDTVANYVCINVAKSVDKAYATLQDILYYTINITNTGNINAINTVFQDIIQSDAAFISGSVTINGVSYPSYDPNLGFTLGTICPSNDIEVQFQVRVISKPIQHILYDQANLTYSYQPNPTGSVLTATANSNIVQTTIKTVAYTVTKTVNKIYAQLGDKLIYTSTITNTGNAVLQNIVFADYIPNWLSFDTGTVFIDGTNYPTYNPTNSFPIGNVGFGESITVAYQVTIVGIPEVGYIPNISEFTITYQVIPTAPIITTTVFSNEVITFVPQAIISVVKNADKAYAQVGDTLSYSFTVSNIGNTPAFNTLFMDMLQSQLSFVTGSVYVNGVNKPEYSPVTGFTLGTIQPGQVVTVQFSATINSLPTNPNNITNSATTIYSYKVNPDQPDVTKTATSNTVTTIVNAYSANLTKSVDKAYATIGNELNYTVVLNNTGTVPLTNINFTDVIPTGATFVAESVKIDGTSYPTYNPNTGFAIPNAPAGGNITVQFKATVTSVPTPPTINNTANVTLNYKLSPTSPDISTSLTSNTVTTNVNIVAVTNTKSVDKAYATVGDTLTYTSVIANNGNVDLTDTMYFDNVPPNTTFVSGTVKINGTSYPALNPNDGFTLGTITPGTSITITHNVTVDSLPSEGYIVNESLIYYNYQINPNTQPIMVALYSNLVTTYINVGLLTVTKATDRTTAILGNVVTYSFVLTNGGNTTLTNILFKDIVQSQSSFNTGTVFVNGVNVPSANPNTGFALSDIPVGQQTTVSFKVTVNSVPPNNKLLNQASVDYKYYINPTGTPISQTATSNITEVNVFNNIVSANKSVDKAIAKIGNTLNFTINIINSGNVLAQNVFFKDILDSNISFVPNSVTINGTPEPGFNPNTGFNLQNIAAGATTTVTFQATIVTRPTNNIVYNFATIDYSYTIAGVTTQATITTNITQTVVAVGELTITKAVDKLYATVGDNIGYTVTITNTGSVNATNLGFKDLIPTSTSFNTGTVVVDGVSQPTFNPNTGFALTDLAPKQSHTITFNIKVDSLPSNGKVENTADITFTYQLTPTDQPVTTTTTSNKVTTLINIATLTATKAVDKAYATLQNILNYTITINNTGNVNASNVFFQDTIQTNASFVSGSVKINGVTFPSYNPNTGFNLSDIAVGGSTTVTFAVTVQTLPSDYTIRDQATVNYEYFVNPANPAIMAQVTTNTVQTLINVGSLAVTKAVNKAYATLNDLIIYTVNILNTGNTVAKNVNFRDVIPTGLTFVAGSVTINGTSYPSYNPYDSFTLGNLQPGDSLTIGFNATVTSVPNPPVANNTANVTFSYNINPTQPDVSLQVDSNTVTTQIKLGSLSLVKSVDKQIAQGGDVLTYTVVVTNNGNVSADNATFTDSLQSNLTFNQGTVTIDGTGYPTYNPNTGFSLGNIAPLTSVTVVFTATVVAQPTSATVENFAVAAFQYKINPNEPYINSSAQSNTVLTVLVKPNLVATKSVDKAYATLQDTLNYSVLIQNTGNIVISQLFFTDFLSNGAVFKPGTVIIGGVSYPNYNPIDGFSLPNSLSGGSSVTVQFQATVTTVPTPPQITNYAITNGVYKVDPQGPDYPIVATSNTVTTQVNVGNLSNVKTVDKDYAEVDGILTYTSTITNTGNVNATNLFFSDVLQTGLSFVSGTVSINGTGYPTLNPNTGFALSNLSPGQSVVVVFNAKITSLPAPPIVTNTSNVQFSYKVNPSGSTITVDKPSNTVSTNVVLGQLTAVKSVDKTVATLNEDITYTITITNTGNVIAYSSLFQDTPSTGVTFKTGSVKINNVSQPTYNPISGFSLGDIGIGNVVTVEFKVTVVSVPPTNKVTNQAEVTFEYVVDPKQPAVVKTTFTNIVTTDIAYANLTVTKAVNKQYATIGDQLTYTITIVNTGNINATNVVFLDETPDNSIFVTGSVTVNGTSYPTYNPSAGFNLGTMTPGQIITVVYKVQVIDLC